MNVKYIVVGSGLSGSVIARELAECGHTVEVWDRRNHIGGNMYDYIDKHGILVHKYGPHTFHTTQKYLYDYICKYGDWNDYKLTCMAYMEGKFTPTPFNFTTIDDYYNEDDAKCLKERIVDYFKDKEIATVLEVLQCDDEVIREYGQFLFDKDYSLYTAKQWGISPKEIDPSVLRRVPLRFSYKTGYFDDEYQCMPNISYTTFFKNILYHKNITIHLGVDAKDKISIVDNSISVKGESDNVKVVYTGALDELFDGIHGYLPYRSLRFEWQYDEVDSKQDAPVVAYPQADKFTRITEYKKLPVQDVKGTSYAVEYPLQYIPNIDVEPYYPVPTVDSLDLYNKYKQMADNVQNFYYCGRLADFKYYNMDQALDRALLCIKEIKKG